MMIGLLAPLNHFLLINIMHAYMLQTVEINVNYIKKV